MQGFSNGHLLDID